MYTEIGAFDAKAKLSELLRFVKNGRRYTITLRGEPVADLIPSEHSEIHNQRDAIMQMKLIIKVRGVTKTTLKNMIAEGRR